MQSTLRMFDNLLRTIYLLHSVVQLADSSCLFDVKMSGDYDFASCDAYIKDSLQGLKHVADELEKAIDEYKKATVLAKGRNNYQTACTMKVFTVDYAGK